MNEKGYKPITEFTAYEVFRWCASAILIALGLGLGFGVSPLALAPAGAGDHSVISPVIGAAIALVGLIWGCWHRETRPNMQWPDHGDGG